MNRVVRDMQNKQVSGVERVQCWRAVIIPNFMDALVPVYIVR
jgi:hypothetical protein